MQSRSSAFSRALGILGASTLLGSLGWSQSINIDCDDPAAAAGAGIPAAGFFAAAPISFADVWNGVAPGAAAGVPLVNTAGAATLATCGHTGGFSFSFNNAGTFLNDQLLLDDLQCLPGPTTWTIGGLLAGNYDVYSYAWAPDNPVAFITTVAVAGAVQPAQNVGGAGFAGAYATPTHYAFHTVLGVPAGGAIAVTFTTFAGFGSMNGIQLRHTPAPPPVVVVDCQTLPTVSQGCNSVLSFTGAPSATTGTFITTYGVMNAQVNGVVFYGITGPAAAPWSPESMLCVKAPIQRLNAVPNAAGNTNGTVGNCDGGYSFDMNPVIQGAFGTLGTPMAAGQQVNSQGWQRDPASAKTTNLTDSFSYVVGP